MDNQVGEFLRKHDLINRIWLRKALLKAVETGEIPVLTWIYEHHNLTMDDIRDLDGWVLTRAVKHGQLDVLKWIHHTFKLTDQDIRGNENLVIRSAARQDHLDILKWVHQTFQLTIDDVRSCDNAILQVVTRNSYHNILTWLAETFTLTLDDEVLILAVTNPDIRIFTWFQQHFAITDKEITTDLLHQVIKNSTTNRFQFLCHSYSLEHAQTTDHSILLAAVQSGKLDTLKWLHQQYRVTQHQISHNNHELFREAANTGYRHILIWLHRIHPTPPNQDHQQQAFTLAVLNGDVETLKWLKQTYQMHLSRSRYIYLVDTANRAQHQETVTWLQQTYDQQSCCNLCWIL